MVKKAIISVFDKSNLDVLVKFLEKDGYEIYSTGGSAAEVYKFLENKEKLINISEYTESPEICEGRVKTLHPKIFGGILGKREKETHHNDVVSVGGVFFDLVVVNLYPFAETLEKTDDEDELLENIDIGGHSLIRAGMKNYHDISVLVYPELYNRFIEKKIINLELAKYASRYILMYDNEINTWFNNELGRIYTPYKELKYGFNPYMKPACVYVKNNIKPPYSVINGEPGYINLLDCENAIKLVLEAKECLGVDYFSSFKHTSPAGVARTFKETRNIDPKSSFGDIIGYSGMITSQIADEIKNVVSDGIIAYDYTIEALEILMEKKNGKYLILKQQQIIYEFEARDVNGTTIMQPSNNSYYKCEDDSVPEDIKNDMSLGYISLKYTQSNSVCFVYKGKVIGTGAGQQNRVDCVEIAGKKSADWFERNNIEDKNGLVLVSDAFFPFQDNIEVAYKYGVDYILQPGGSIRDKEVIQKSEEMGIKMVLSGMRVFTH